MPHEKAKIFIVGFLIFCLFCRKNRTMKNRFFLPLGLAVLLSGCVFLDDGLTGSRSRADCSRDGTVQSGPQKPAGSRPDTPAAADTVLYFSAIRFPADYDWQRDTAYGSVGFELLLFRDGEAVQTLTSGPGVPFVPDPDRHHILSGRLYSERMLGGETLIGRDGQELFRFAGREFLLGLLEDDGDLHTLSRPAGGQGFSYRRNGQLLMQHPDGTPYGNLSDPSYGPSGALYRDGGKICFCYHEGSEGRRSHFLVCDGETTRMTNIQPTQTVLDLKLHDGTGVALYPSLLLNRLSEGRIWPEKSGHAVTGRFSDGSGGWFSGYLDAGSWSVQHRLCDEEAALYHTSEASFAVSTDGDGTVCWYGPDGAGRSDGACFFFSPACATAAGARLFLALTPKDRSRRPQIRIGGQVREIDLWGYISRVAVEVSPPS